MAVTTYKSVVTTTDTPHVYQAQVRDFTLNFDTTGRHDGYEVGMQPNEAILASLGACESIVAASFHHKQHFDYSSLYITLKSSLAGDRLDDIHMDIHFRTNQSKEEAADFVEFMENTCPVRDNLVNTVPVVFN